MAGLPGIKVRVLVFVYQEQFAWVKWGNARSQQFKIVNGTRQGSVLSPSLFSLYMNELLVKLRNSGLGCHIGGVFFGAALYADDLVLLAPCRSVLQKMLKICENYAEIHNLKFSTDPNPALSKTKCLYMVGKVRGGHISYPKPVTLYGSELPWVQSANHLGHTLHQDCTMMEDVRCKRIKFISESTDIREMFSWAHPMQVVNAIKIYCTSFYGSMLWNLFDEEANKVYRCWNTALKLAWRVPRNTFTFLVDKVLSMGTSSIRDSLFSRYQLFLKSVRTSTATEIQVLAAIAENDVRSTTGLNKARMLLESGHQNMCSIPCGESWRVPYFERLLQQRDFEQQLSQRDKMELEDMIDIVASSTFY